jgi:AcrR family transcriptional regulator
MRKHKERGSLARPKNIEELVREFILDRSEELFIAKGYQKTSMDMIARDCGLSKPTLYNYFTNKYELFTSLYVRLYKSLYGTLEASLSGGLDKREILEGFIDQYFALMTSKKEFLKMYFREQHLVIHENIEEHMTWHIKSRKLMEDLLTRFLEGLVRPDIKKTYGAGMVASTLFDILEGAVSDLILHGDQDPAEEKTFILELLGRGVLNK